MLCSSSVTKTVTGRHGKTVAGKRETRGKNTFFVKPSDGNCTKPGSRLPAINQSLTSVFEFESGTFHRSYLTVELSRWGKKDDHSSGCDVLIFQKHDT